MIKKNKGKLIISSLIILFPAAAGLLMWNILPERMAVHWGLDGTADGWSGRFLTVFAPSLSMLAAHWLCIAVTAADPKNKNQTKKALGMIFWICPVISLLTGGFLYASAFGMEFHMNLFLPLLMGLIFAGFGNYLPKCRQNSTLGVRIKWTLESEENWNATHRFCGKLWVIGGVLLLFGVFLPGYASVIFTFFMILLLSIIPMIYSWRYHCIQKKNGTEVLSSSLRQGKKKGSRTAIIFTAVILIGAALLLFTGDIKMQYREDSFRITASFWPDRTVDYKDIEDIEYREQVPGGIRTNGLGSFRLLAGAFSNEEFGAYTRYTYTKCSSGIVLTVNGKKLVISGKNDEATREIYEELLKRTGL